MVQKREYAFKVMLLVSDACALVAAYALSLWLRFVLFSPYFDKQEDPGTLEAYAYLMPMLVAAWLVIFRASGAYAGTHRLVDTALVLTKGVFYGTLFILAAHSLARGFSYSRGALLFFVPLALVGSFLCRVVVQRTRMRVLAGTNSLIRLAIIGTEAAAEKLAREIAHRPEIGYDLVGIIGEPAPARAGAAPEASAPPAPAPRSGSALAVAVATPVIAPPASRPGFPDRPFLGTADRLAVLLREHALDEVWIAMPSAERAAIRELLEVCLEAKISWKIVPDLYAMLVDWLNLDSLGGVPLLGMKRNNITGLNVAVKRALDLALASGLLLIFSPIMALAALLIRLSSPGAVLFRQARVGKGGRIFTCYKFRTMYVAAGEARHEEFAKAWVQGAEAAVEQRGSAQVYKMTSDPRVTGIGRFLRKFSLDELPQLFNVVKGEMSVIGPRPPIQYEVDIYQEWHRRRLEVNPGITGLWQVSGRNRLSFDEMVKLDVYYIENWSVLLDLKIAFKTAWVMLFGDAY
ncbi:MAG: sugar transferase [Planctomycetes bacterium]|nr:sugar transferase [Planctomycetota bacterium]